MSSLGWVNRSVKQWLLLPELGVSILKLGAGVTNWSSEMKALPFESADFHPGRTQPSKMGAKRAMRRSERLEYENS